MTTLTPQQAAETILRRREAADSLAAYAGYIDLPGRAVDADEDSFAPVETALAAHHIVICQAIQRTMERRFGRLVIMAPPGAAKSSYASVAAPTWAMGKWPGHRIILASHGTKIAVKQSKKARQICRSTRFSQVFGGATLPPDQRAADEWALTNGSQFMAGGILSGITGNRADGVVFDDPLAGREEAESEVTRTKVWEAYLDDLRSRLVPGGWLVGMLTRWHERDWAGMVLPEGWQGQSGVFTGTDGLDWEVVCLPSKIETVMQEETDPVGRKMGEYLWPEWFTREHWVMNDPALGSVSANTPTGRRAWASMHQQQPKPDDGILFRREDFQWYDPAIPPGEAGGRPANLRVYGASDYAVTERVLGNDPDFTEHGIAGFDVGTLIDGSTRARLWIFDWWSGQERTDTSIAAFIALVRRHTPQMWFGEKGVIEKAIGPAVDRAIREAGHDAWVERTLLPTVGDKAARVHAFKVMVEEHRVYLPRGVPWAEALVEQLCGFPGVRYDDKVDVAGLFGRGLDHMWDASPILVREDKPAPRPFTYEWAEEQMAQDAAAKHRRAAYFT